MSILGSLQISPNRLTYILKKHQTPASGPHDAHNDVSMMNYETNSIVEVETEAKNLTGNYDKNKFRNARMRELN